MKLQGKQKIKRKPKPHSLSHLQSGLFIVLVVWGFLAISLLRPRRDVVLQEIAALSHEGRLNILQWSPDEARVVTVSYDGTIHLWDRDGMSIVGRGYLDSIHEIFWAPTSTRFVAISATAIYVWGLKGQVAALQAVNPTHIRWNPTGDRFILTSNNSNDVALLYDQDGGFIATLEQYEPDHVLWNKRGNRILGGRYQWEQIALWDSDGVLIAMLEHGEAIRSFRWNEAGTQILTASDDGYVTIWDTAGKPVRSFAHHQPVGDAIWSPNEERILSSGYNQPYTTFMWDTAGNLLNESLNRSRYPVWSHDGQFFVRFPRRLDYEATINEFQIFNADANLVQVLWQGEEWQPVNVDWHPADNRLLSWGRDRENENYAAYVCDIEGNILVTLPHQRLIEQAMWSPDGDMIITVSGAIVNLWSSDGQLINQLIHAQSVQSVRWSQDGEHLLTHASFPSAGSVETALWTSDGLHVLTEHHGMDFNRRFAGWAKNFDRVFMLSSNHVGLYKMGVGPVYLDLADQ